MLSALFTLAVFRPYTGAMAYVTQAQYFDQQIYETENIFHTFLSG